MAQPTRVAARLLHSLKDFKAFELEIPNFRSFEAPGSMDSWLNGLFFRIPEIFSAHDAVSLGQVQTLSKHL